MKHVRVLFVIFFLVLVFVIAVQNYENLKTPLILSVNLLFFRYETPGMPLASVAVICFLIGTIIMGLYGLTERFRLRRQIKTLLAEARERDNELNSLRNLPVTTEVVNLEQDPEMQ